MHNEWATPGRMFRLLGRVGELVVQWRAKDASNAHCFRFGEGGRAELRCVFRDWPVLPPVEVYVPGRVTDVVLEIQVDGTMLVTFSSGERVILPIPMPSTKLGRGSRPKGAKTP